MSCEISADALRVHRKGSGSDPEGDSHRYVERQTTTSENSAGASRCYRVESIFITVVFDTNYLGTLTSSGAYTERFGNCDPPSLYKVVIFT